MRHIDTTDDRRTAESLLAVRREDIPAVISNLTYERRLSIAVSNLNRLVEHPLERDLGQRALRHLGFGDA